MAEPQLLCQLHDHAKQFALMHLVRTRMAAAAATTKKDTSVTFWAEQFFSVMLMTLL